MCLSVDGRLLAVALRGAAGCLLLTAPQLQPLARLSGGQGGPCSGLAMPGERVMACWADGTMLTWPMVEKQVPRRDEELRRQASPGGRGVWSPDPGWF